jgi:hypothetical protein
MRAADLRLDVIDCLESLEWYFAQATRNAPKIIYERGAGKVICNSIPQITHLDPLIPLLFGKRLPHA